MEFSIKSGSPERIRTGCIIIGVFEPRKLTTAGTALDRASHGQLAAALKRGDMEGKRGTTLMLQQLPRVAAARVLLVGLGRERELDEDKFRDAVAKAIGALKQTGVTEAVLCLSAEVKQRDLGWRAAQAAIAAADSTYRFDRMKSKRESARGVRHLTLLVAERGALAAAETGMNQGAAIALGMSLAKDLGNLPPNVCTPSYLAQSARDLGKQYKLSVQVLERKDMEKLGMGSLLSVARGSDEPPKLIVVKYDGGPRGEKPYALVGKGVTF
ncbi:MAG: leucyl aminopeptidase, partial [Betaproteobacteria bacterium]|nr:leucyl aminopeptidase [Betaproteobacteria bacterium]